MAFEMVKAMHGDGLEWAEGYRPLGRQALVAILEGRMSEAVDRYPDRLDPAAITNRRNGYYARRLLTELGDIELRVPRTRHYSPCEVVRAYSRRTADIDRAIFAGFVLGLSTRKASEVLLTLLGWPVSATTVSTVARTLDASVAAFHRRPLKDAYKALMLDCVILARKTSASALRRPVLVALGLRPDGKKEIIDFWLATGESAAEWQRFPSDLLRRGLTGAKLQMICVDGGQGLIAALPTVFHGIPVQRCWAHKLRNVLDKAKKAEQPAVKRSLHAVMNARHEPAARHAARHFADRWQLHYPNAVACLRRDLDELLTCFRYKTLAARNTVRTTNAIERRFRAARRRTRPITFQDRTSIDRILFPVFSHENKLQGVTPFLLTHNN
jgi:transposase-like protein